MWEEIPTQRHAERVSLCWGATVDVAFLSTSERGALHHCWMTLQLTGQHYQPLYMHRWSPNWLLERLSCHLPQCEGSRVIFWGLGGWQLKRTGQNIVFSVSQVFPHEIMSFSNGLVVPYRLTGSDRRAASVVLV